MNNYIYLKNNGFSNLKKLYEILDIEPVLENNIENCIIMTEKIYDKIIFLTKKVYTFKQRRYYNGDIIEGSKFDFDYEKVNRIINIFVNLKCILNYNSDINIQKWYNIIIKISNHLKTKLTISENDEMSLNNIKFNKFITNIKQISLIVGTILIAPFAVVLNQFNLI